MDILVEGDTDAAVVSTLLRSIGIAVGTIYGRRGIAHLKAAAYGISRRAQFGYQVLIVADSVDLGHGCVAEKARSIVKPRPKNCAVRLAVPEIESWVLASRAELAQYLGVPLKHIPDDPDRLMDAKSALINAARRSRQSAVRDAMVPRPGASIGPGYVDQVEDFMRNCWRIETACSVSRSLASAVARLKEMRP